MKGFGFGIFNSKRRAVGCLVANGRLRCPEPVNQQTLAVAFPLRKIADLPKFVVYTLVLFGQQNFGQVVNNSVVRVSYVHGIPVHELDSDHLNAKIVNINFFYQIDSRISSF